MIDVQLTETFSRWLAGLRDGVARKRVATRLILLRQGHFGNAKSVGEGVSELRVDHGPGYRLYFTRRRESVVILLCGGDKNSQQRDIAKAKVMAADYL